ncbi:MAG TPA: metallophosphoesterase, partial [Tepidisphaeraceae bacterium]|nr:metallophosphoesterase [Tepidisphaeraceae bacterium]
MRKANRFASVEPLENRVFLSTSRLALISDFGTLQGSEAAVANLVKGWDTIANPLDAIITSGDNDQNNGDDYVNRVGNYYDQFIYGRGSGTQRFLPAPGNHDWGYTGRNTLEYYESFFTLPDASQGNTSGNERYYNYKVGAVEVFVLDSYSYEPDGTSSTSAQATWLKTALANSTAPWQLVTFHHTAYSSAAAHDDSTYMQWPFQEWGADLVVSGHNHVYERININGLRYVTNGMGGWDSLNGFGTPVAGSEVRYNAENGAILLEATATTLSYSFI